MAFVESAVLNGHRGCLLLGCVDNSSNSMFFQNRFFHNDGASLGEDANGSIASSNFSPVEDENSVFLYHNTDHGRLFVVGCSHGKFALVQLNSSSLDVETCTHVAFCFDSHVLLFLYDLVTAVEGLAPGIDVQTVHQLQWLKEDLILLLGHLNVDCGPIGADDDRVLRNLSRLHFDVLLSESKETYFTSTFSW